MERFSNPLTSASQPHARVLSREELEDVDGGLEFRGLDTRGDAALHSQFSLTGDHSFNGYTSGLGGSSWLNGLVGHATGTHGPSVNSATGPGVGGTSATGDGSHGSILGNTGTNTGAVNGLAGLNLGGLLGANHGAPGVNSAGTGSGGVDANGNPITNGLTNGLNPNGSNGNGFALLGVGPNGIANGPNGVPNGGLPGANGTNGPNGLTGPFGAGAPVVGALGGPLGSGPGALGGVLPWGASAYLPGGLGGTVPGSGGFGAGQAINTQSFELKSWGDPHNNITINGTALEQIDTTLGINNFGTFGNTTGGPTTISTDTTGTSGGTYNDEVHFTSRTWSLDAISDADGDIDVALRDARGTYILQEGQSVTQADGSVISHQDGHLTVTQRLNDGGVVTSEITLNGAQYLDIETRGQGNAMLSGWTAEQFTQRHPGQVGASPLGPVQGAPVTNFPVRA